MPSSNHIIPPIKLTKEEVAKAREKAKLEYDMTMYLNNKKIIAAQLFEAIGAPYIYKRYIEEKENGKIIYHNVRVTDSSELGTALDYILNNGGNGKDEEIGLFFYVNTKSPSPVMMKDVLDRSQGKPKEGMDINFNASFSLLNIAEAAKKLSSGEYKVIDQPAPNDIPAEFTEEYSKEDTTVLPHISEKFSNPDELDESKMIF